MLDRNYSEQLIIAANQNIEEKAYWLEKLSGKPVKSCFPYDFNRKEGPVDQIHAVNFRFTDKLFQRLMKISNKTDQNLHMIMVAAIVLLLDRYTYKGSKDIIVGAPIYKQETEAEFINTVLALRTRWDSQMTFKELLLQVRQTIAEAGENQNYPLEILLQQLNIESTGNGYPLFGIAILVENIHDKAYMGDIKTDMAFRFSRRTGCIKGILEYNALLYRETTVRGIAGHLTNLLQETLSNVETKITDIDILSEEERTRLINEFNNNEKDFPRHKTCHQFIEDHAERIPGQEAVRYTGQSLTYKELNKRANGLARVLEDAGIHSDEPVGILMHRCPMMVVSILAVWKANGAYIPIETGYPLQRLKGILEDSDSKVLITESRYVTSQLENAYNGHIVRLDALAGKITRESEQNPGWPLDMNHLSYIIYTSGSTGKPKGAMVEHIGMMNHISAKIDDLEITAQGIVAQNATHCFDISVWQFFAPLTVGGKTIIYPDSLVLEPPRFIDQLIKDHVTLLEVVPSYLSLMLGILDKNPRNFESLQYLLVTGEVVRLQWVEQWFNKYPRIKMVNAYGPTEASDDITHHIMERTPDTERVPIGKPLQNLNIYIVNQEMQLCPVGVSGEICVSGVGVGRGYLKDKEKTQKAFMEDPFPGKKAVRLYKTGDLGRWLPDGTIDFLGRIDNQVKIRGFRIECGEIENILLNHEKINEAVVIAREDKHKNNYLVAYIKTREELSEPTLRLYLQELLPSYMVPAYFVRLESFPLTGAGKIDKKALPEPVMESSPGLLHEAAETETQAALVNIWQQVLELEQVGIHNNFFSLGGDSIKGIRMVNQIQEWLGEIIHVALIFERPTIKELAAALDNYKTPKRTTRTRIHTDNLREFRQVIPSLSPLKAKAGKNPAAVFILCAPRTGSTLLRVILAGHAKIFAPPEPELLLFNTLQERKEELSGPFSHFKEGTIRAIMEIKNCGPEEAKAFMETFEKENLTIRQFYGKIQQWLGSRLLVDKTANYSLSPEALKRAEDYFASPKYIHLTRHPYAVIHSYEQAKLDQVFRYKHNFTLRQLAELVWLASEQNISEFLKEIPPGRQYFVRYEELVHQPEVVVPGICEFLHLAFDPQMLNVYTNLDKKMTDGLYAQSRMIGDVKFFQHLGIDADTAEQWKSQHADDFLGDISLQVAQGLGYLTEPPGPGYRKIKPTEESRYYPLSHAQKRLWILNRFEANQLVYHIPVVYMLKGELNRQVLENAYESIIKRHQSLRTAFTAIRGKPVQKIHDYDPTTSRLEFINLREKRNKESQTRLLVNRELSTPFDLSTGPLVRAKLIQAGENQYVFVFTMHHIVTDGWSMGILVKELLALYSAYNKGREDPLSPLSLQYKDYAVWQNSEKQQNLLNKQEVYWKNQFAGEIPVLELPTDYPRPGVRSVEGSTVRFDIGSPAARGITSLASRKGTSLYMVLLSVYTIFLSKITNQESLVIGTPVAGRSQPELEQIIGMFVNTLALKNELSGDMTLTGFINEITVNTLEAFAHQDYPYELLVEKLAVERDTARSPLFDTMFAMQAIDIPKIDIPGLEVTPYEYQTRTAKFDLTLNASETEESISFVLEYSTKLFKKETIERFAGYFKGIVSRLPANPGVRLGEIEILSEEEKNQVLYDLNQTTAAYPADSTLHYLFEVQAEQTPDHIAVVGSSETLEQHQTYKELSHESHQLANLLREKGVKADTLVAIMVDRSIEMVIGILGILKSGSAYLPIDPKSPGVRIKYMLDDSSAKVLLASPGTQVKAEFKEKFIEIIDITNALSSSTLILTSTSRLAASADNLAYVIYTSGTTGNPRGVLVEHKNAVNVVTWFARTYQLQSGVHTLLMSDYTFDASVNQIFATLLHGAALYVIGKHLVLDIEALRQYIERHHIRLINFVPMVLKELLGSRERLTGLQVVISGADTLDNTTKEMIREKGYRLYNQYGPTETTIDALMWECTDRSVTLGKPIANVRCYILDKYGNPLPPGTPGELVVSGAGVSRGYLNQQELTVDRFLYISYKSYRSDKTYISKKIYKTGDLVRWLPDGNIQFLGRIDQQVKIRGNRIEPGEIETRLKNISKINEAVVIPGQKEPGEKFLCAYIVSHEKIDIPKITGTLAKSLPDYMIPAYWMQMDKIPLTPAGKVNKKALPKPEVKSGEKYTAPRDKIEEKLVKFWSEVLNSDAPIGIDDNFFHVGGNSLKATLMVSMIKKEFQVKLPLMEIFQQPFIRGLAQYIKEAAEDKYIVIEAVEKKDYYALSSTQRRLYVLQQMDKTGTVYNMLWSAVLEGKIDRHGFTGTVEKLVQRHESLRTSIQMIEDNPVQRIHDKVKFEIEYHDAGRKAQRAKRKEESNAPCVMRFSSTIKNFIRPFDLSRAPLLRVGLIKQARQTHILMVDMHHIISDGISKEILVKDFIALYAGETLSLLKLHYKDYSQWQNRAKEKEVQLKQGAYWQNRFQGEIPVLELPTDYGRPHVPGFEGNRISFEIVNEETRTLNHLAVEHGATLYMLLLAIYNVFLSKITFQESIIIGTAVAGRGHGDLKEIIGMFVNTLGLLNHPSGQKTFSEFLREVKDNTLDAFENQDYPFEELVEKIPVTRDTGRNPLFDVMFAMQDMEIAKLEIPGLKILPYSYESHTAKFDLMLLAAETEEGLQCVFEYRTRLFKQTTIQRLIQFFKKTISGIVQKPTVKISGIEIIPGAEKQRILLEFNNTAAVYPSNQWIHRLFEKEVDREPGKIAVVYEDRSLSYQDLNRRAQQLAVHLRAKGLTPEIPVGIMSGACLEIIIGVQAILKAGGAYMPIDPNHPGERIRFMLTDSGAEILLTNMNSCPSWLSDEPPVLLNLSEESHPDAARPLRSIPLEAIPAGNSYNLAYIIYTSGSTGKPKGVMVEHRNVVRLVKCTNYIVFNKGNRILQTGALEFDASTFEIWGALLNGLTLYLASKDNLLTPGKLKHIIKQNQITTLWMTSPLFNQMVESDLRIFSGLQNLLVGGDVLSPVHINRVRKRFPWLNIINGYGPTENTTFSTSFLIEEEYQESIPIGKPIANSTAFIVAGNGLLQPIGIAGELWVGGDGVARGYLNNPELTAEKFDHDLWDNQDYHDGNHRSYGTYISYNSKKLYKTGDLARWQPDGNIQFLGRRDQQIKIRGFRIEPGEIENHLLKHTNIKSAIVRAAKDNNGDRNLCAYIVTHSDIPVPELKKFLSASLPGYMIPYYIVPLESIPLTPNGKVDWRALPPPETAAQDNRYTAPRNKIEEKLLEIWANILGIKKELMGIDSDFFELGGHSIKATSLASHIHKELEIHIPLVEIFTTPTVQGLADYIIQSGKEKFQPIERTEKKEYYALSSAQKRIYILQQMDKQGIGYNIPSAFLAKGTIDVERLTDTFRQLIKRHESLRTSFKIVQGEPVQRIHAGVEFEIECHEAERKAQSAERKEESAERKEEGHAPCAVLIPGTIKNFHSSI
jgi:amino acid adenylation domain-containing protein